MDKKIMIGLVIGSIMIVSGITLSGYPAPRGTDVSIKSAALVQNEISLTLIPGTQPGKPQVLLAAYNDNPYSFGSGIGYGYSTDGGATWTTGNLPFPFNPLTGMNMDQEFDPTATSDTLGNLYIGHIASEIGGSSGLYVHKSTNGGGTWLSPVTVALDGPPSGDPDPLYRFNDRCQMTADTFSGSPYTNNIYITWIKDRGFHMPQPWSDVYFSYSTNQGVSFSSAVRINDIGHDMGNMPIPAVAPNGTVYVVWMDYNVTSGGNGTIYLDKSFDGGVTWGTDQFVAQINLPPLRLNTAAGFTDVLAKGGTPIAVSPTNSSELYIVYAADPDGNGTDEADIFFIKSTDGGSSWSSPLRVNDDSTKNDQFLPWMDVKSDGTIDIAWYDRRNDVNDSLWDVYFAKSTDGGSSFSQNIQLNDISFPTPTNLWMGEYLGLAVDSNYAFVAFTSSLTDVVTGDVYFDKVPNSLSTVYVDDDYNASTPGWQIDHFDTIQGAIDAVDVNGTVIVYNGTYTENIVVNKSITLQAGSNPVIDGNGTGDVIYISADWVTINGFTIQNSGTNWGDAGIEIATSNQCNVSRNNISTSNAGIVLSSSNNNVVLNNSIINNQYGIVGSSSSNNTISGNTINSNNYGDGIYLSSSSNNTISHNTITSNNAAGIYFDPSCNYNTISGNNISSNDDGIDIYGSVSNNYNTLSGNTIWNNSGYGIYFDWSRSNTISNNTISSNNYDGIWLFGSDNTTVFGNNILSNNEDGIYIEESDNNNVSDNIISNNGWRGIYIEESDNNTVSDNTIGNNSVYGVYIYSSIYNTLTGNTLTYNFDGIRLGLSNHITITNNTIANSNYSGIWVSSSSTNNTITNNTISHNRYGVQFSDSNHSTIANNSISNSSWYGMIFDNSNNNTVSGNTISNNGWRGLHLYSSSDGNLIYNNYFNNTNNAYDDGNNTWNITKTSGTNIINGSYLGGNFWSDYAGSDTNGDGLGDTDLPYNCSGNIANGGDWHPLVTPSTPSIDYITITFGTENEIPPGNMSTGFTFTMYATAFNT
ncbi:MAG: hypothetical protein DRN07_00575, partial [Thermoplasmata archaeon]